MPGPPNKFESFVNLTGVADGADTVAALNTAYAAFYTNYGVYPTDAITRGNYVYLGAYAD